MTTATVNPEREMTDRPSGTRVYVNLSEVYVDPEMNLRQVADNEEELASFAASIESTNGLMSPIGIYKTPEHRLKEHGMPYELGYGYRRCAALNYLAETSGDSKWIEDVPANLKEGISQAKRHVEQLIENLQRRDLNQMEIGIALKRAITDSESDLTATQLAKEIGWSLPTVSVYLKAANNLSPKVQDLVVSGKLLWSNARELSNYKIPEDQQVLAAAAGSTMSHEDFKKYLAQTYGEGSQSEGTAEGTSGDESGDASNNGSVGTQKAHKSIRSTELEKKYIPKLQEMIKDEKNKKEKDKLEARLDTIRFVLHEQGTELGTQLAPWEQQLIEEHEKEKLEAEVTRQKTVYVRKAVQAIKAILTEVPPEDAKDRKLATLPEAFERVKQSIIADLKIAKEAGAADNTMPAGFTITSPDDFIQEISTAYADHKKKEADRKAENERKKEEKKKAEEEKAKADAAKVEEQIAEVESM